MQPGKYRYALDPAFCAENGVATAWADITGGGVEYPRVGTLGRWSYTGHARRMWLRYFSNFGALYSNGVGRAPQLGARVFYGASYRDIGAELGQDGGPHWTDAIWLFEGRNKTVDLLTPAQNAAAIGDAVPLGTWLMEVAFDAPMTVQAIPAPAKRLVLVGDSIPNGFTAPVPQLHGLAGQLKRGTASGGNGYNGSVKFVGWGSRLLRDYCAVAGVPNLAAATAFVTSLLAGGTTEIGMFIGTNDWFMLVSEANFRTMVQNFLDQVIAQSATVKVKWQVPIRRGAEAGNVNGFLLEDYRQILRDECTARAPRCTAFGDVNTVSEANMLYGLGGDQTHVPTEAAGNILRALWLANLS